MFTKPTPLFSFVLALLVLLLNLATPTAALPAAIAIPQPTAPTTHTALLPTTPAAAAAPENLDVLSGLDALPGLGALGGLSGGAHGGPLSLLGRVAVAGRALVNPGAAAVLARTLKGEEPINRRERFQLRMARAAAI